MIHRIAPLALAALGAGLFACKKPPENTEAEARVIPLAAEDVARARRTGIQTGPRIAGSLDPRQRATVRAKAAGSVTAVDGELGQAVEKGNLLARIEAGAQDDAVRSARASLRSATESLAVARREVERTEALVRGGALAKRDLDTARSSAVAADARVDAARAELAAARTQLSDTTARAPIDGVISKASVHRGDVVTIGAELFTIIDPSSMRLEASVTSEHLGAIEIGTPVRFQVRGYPGQTFVGQVKRIAPAADPQTRQIPILVEIPNESGKLVAGLFAEGRLTSERREALVVPTAAIDTSSGAATVTRVVDGVVERVAVKLGATDDAAEVVEVTAGLAEGDVVLLRAARSLATGTRVSMPEGTGTEPAAPTADAVSKKPGSATPAPTATKPAEAATTSDAGAS